MEITIADVTQLQPFIQESVHSNNAISHHEYSGYYSNKWYDPQLYASYPLIHQCTGWIGYVSHINKSSLLQSIAQPGMMNYMLKRN